MKRTWLGWSATVLVAACGGGQDGRNAVAAELSPAAASGERAQALAGDGWVRVASENDTFTLAASQTVRYGAGNAWVSREASGSVTCSNWWFGNDPAFGVVKGCEVVDAQAASSGATSASGSWQTVAQENGGFIVAGTRPVRYGAGDAWVQRSVTGAGTCSNWWFGSDPAFGTVKRCEAWNDGSTVAAAPSPAPAPAPAPAPTPAPAPAPSPAPAPAPAASTFGTPRDAATVFVSGHSLTSTPMFAAMQSVAQAKGTPMAWNQQNVPGSPLRWRTRGPDASSASFTGYRLGSNLGTTNMDVVAELLNPQTTGGRRYDTLVVTERHDVIGTLMWEDTVRYARHYHDRLIAGNAAANSYLYHAWLPVRDKSNPAAWVAYERTAAWAWQCAAARVNVSLAAAGRGDRMAYLPAGLALAELVEQAAVRGAVPGISAGSAAATIDRLFTDNVHLTPLGEYYIGLVSYASVYRRAPTGTPAPAGVSGEQASALQNIAWQAVANHYNSAVAPTMDQCRAAMRDQVCTAYANQTGNPGGASGCISFFGQASSANPFHYDVASDRSYWFN
jgi:hypothetical protein